MTSTMTKNQRDLANIAISTMIIDGIDRRSGSSVYETVTEIVRDREVFNGLTTLAVNQVIDRLTIN